MTMGKQYEEYSVFSEYPHFCILYIMYARKYKSIHFYYENIRENQRIIHYLTKNIRFSRFLLVSLHWRARPKNGQNSAATESRNGAKFHGL